LSAPSSGRPRIVYSVGQLLGGVSALLEDRVGRVWVSGEIGNLFRAGSGHVYFSLRDEDGAQLRVALFRQSALQLEFDLENGLEVLAHGDVSVYAARGELQLVAKRVEPKGVGALQLALEQLRRRLEAEGLFAAERKRPLPTWPRAIGIVTSAQGAALHDVIQVTARRCPSIPLLISATRVQGEGAELEIAAAIERLSERSDVDVVLLVRGGGSFEDLYAFQREVVVRAIVACRHPVVSGIGHETDFSLADAAADATAPTPSAAAALVTPDGQALARELRARFDALAAAARQQTAGEREWLGSLARALQRASPSLRLAAQAARLASAGRRLGRWPARALHAAASDQGSLSKRLVRAAPLLGPRLSQLEWSAQRLAGALRRRLARAEAQLAGVCGALDALSPLAVLGRGYALVRRESDGLVVREASHAPPGERLRVRVARAEIVATSVASRVLPD
jgi:exodeoxyribonuclease VII large subunit